jgi:hypothetical protein
LSRRRLLFVVSNDHGELSNALYLTRGRDFDATLLLPEKLQALNRDGLAGPSRTESYRSLAEILAALDRNRPDVTFLFSGYLYAINGLLRLDEVETLVAALRRTGGPFVTSDPFVGILSHVDTTTFSDQHPHKAALTEHFARLSRIFAGVRNFYPVPPDDLLPSGSVSAFNPAMIAVEREITEAREWLSPKIGADLARPWWLFVLANEDLLHQSQFHGEATFRATVRDRLCDALRQGCQPILSAPPGVVAPGSIEGLIAIGHAGHRMFTTLLLAVEHAFYWNVFSNSTLLRCLNHRSVHFFGRGHMVHAIRPVFDAGMRLYYRNEAPTMLDPREELRADRLAGLAEAQDRELEPLRKRIRVLPTPEQMVEEFL